MIRTTAAMVMNTPVPVAPAEMVQSDWRSQLPVLSADGLTLR